MDTSKNTDAGRDAELRELVDFEISDIVATAREQGFTARATLDALAASVAESSSALDDEADIAAGHAGQLPAGPHSTPGLVDREKTPDTGALPEPNAGNVDPGVG